MQVLFHTPPEPIGQYVQQYIYHQGLVFPYSIERLVPDGTVNIIFDLTEEPKYIYDGDTLAPVQKCARVWLSGMHTDYLAISAAQNSEMLVVSFKPGGAFPFVHRPLYELQNAVVDAEDVLGTSVLHLRQQILEQPLVTRKFQLVGKWLLERLRQDRVHEAVVNYSVRAIRDAAAVPNFTALSEKTGYSHKQFIHLFKKHVGLTPKAFQRVLRFNRVLNQIHRKEEVDWARLYFDCGYYDQAHFIKEFKQFSGLNPEHYLRTQGEYVNYSPIA